MPLADAQARDLWLLFLQLTDRARLGEATARQAYGAWRAAAPPETEAALATMIRFLAKFLSPTRLIGRVHMGSDLRRFLAATGYLSEVLLAPRAADASKAGGYAVEQTEEFKKRQAQAIHDHAIKSDVIIGTAQIPGKRAPLLLRTETVEAMRPGSVIIDLAASTGGNCELTQNNKTIVHHGIKIIGNSFFPSEIPTDASRMLGKNYINFIKLLITNEGNLNLNWDDDIVKGTLVTHEGQIVHERVKSLINN